MRHTRRRAFIGRVVAVLAAFFIGWGKAFAALPATDNFNRTSLGTNWTVGYGAWSIYNSTEIEGTTNNKESYVYWNADSFNDDHYSEIDWTDNGGGGGLTGPAVRAGGSGFFGFYGRDLTNDSFLFYSNGDGADWNEIASETATGFFNGDTLYLEITGTPGGTSTLVTKVNGGAWFGDQTSSVAYTGAAGVCGFPPGGTDSTGDNWTGDNLGAGPVRPPTLTLMGVGP